MIPEASMLSPPQLLCVMADMIFDECGNEVIAVVITCLHSQVERLIDLLASLLKLLRQEL